MTSTAGAPTDTPVPCYGDLDARRPQPNAHRCGSTTTPTPTGNRHQAAHRDAGLRIDRHADAYERGHTRGNHHARPERDPHVRLHGHAHAPGGTPTDTATPGGATETPTAVSTATPTPTGAVETPTETSTPRARPKRQLPSLPQPPRLLTPHGHTNRNIDSWRADRHADEQPNRNAYGGLRHGNADSDPAAQRTRRPQSPLPPPRLPKSASRPPQPKRRLLPGRPTRRRATQPQRPRSLRHVNADRDTDTGCPTNTPTTASSTPTETSTPGGPTGRQRQPAPSAHRPRHRRRAVRPRQQPGPTSTATPTTASATPTETSTPGGTTGTSTPTRHQHSGQGSATPVSSSTPTTIAGSATPATAPTIPSGQTPADQYDCRGGGTYAGRNTNAV